jgi:hypothetical protein
MPIATNEEFHEIKLSNKWPAVILAARRTLKVIGRINILKDSTKTINLINNNGVPVGTKWVMFFFKFLITPCNKIENHKDNLKDKDNNNWEVQTNVYLINPCKLLYKINNMTDKYNNILPLL